ncbi:hypothetical protein J4Q44_G00206950 [Coregonus suidteri]|uniref:Uncharacterized protein n=1 Tax=Coregonus suidteri TaxID=861788 RepID=A0AAN8R1U0_9TELE
MEGDSSTVPYLYPTECSTSISIAIIIHFNMSTPGPSLSVQGQMHHGWFKPSIINTRPGALWDGRSEVSQEADWVLFQWGWRSLADSKEAQGTEGQHCNLWQCDDLH